MTCYDTVDNGACDGTWLPAWSSMTATLFALEGQTAHYWHVRARNAVGTTYANGGSSTYWTFTTQLTPPGPFGKLSPQNGVFAQQTTVALTWQASRAATGYEYCYDTVNNGACDGSWVSAGNTTSATVALSPSTTYYWQVRATNAAGSTPADDSAAAFWSFTTPMVPPAAFGKSSPANGAQVSTATLSLTWQASAGADTYTFCYDTLDDGACNRNWVWAGNATSATVSGLAPGTTYYWQVRASNGMGSVEANLQTWWSFTTPMPAPPTITTLGLPSAQVGAAYSFPLTATGGAPPYTWAHVNGSVSPGLSLSPAGVLEGTPAHAGTFSFRVRVTGADGGWSEKDFLLTVALFRRYFAEGATGWLFDCYFALANPGSTSAEVTLRFLRSDLQTIVHTEVVPPMSRRTVDVKSVPGMSAAPGFSTVVESNVEIVADRTMTWDTNGYGSHAETSIKEPAQTWYLAEGATQNGFQLYYLIENPNTDPIDVRVRYLRRAPAEPIDIDYRDIPGNSRKTIYVNEQDARLAWGDVSAIVTSETTDRPIIVERAMYQDSGGVMFNAGHASAGVTAPATEWFLAEGATVGTFDMYILLANPGDTSGSATITYMLTDGRTMVKTSPVEAGSRQTVWVNGEHDSVDPTFTLAGVSLSARIQTTVPTIVERAMWWAAERGGPWIEATGAAGTTETGITWAVADGEQGGARSTDTYVLVANTSPFPGLVSVTALGEDGSTPSVVRAVPANSRTTFHMANSPMGADSPFGTQLTGKKFGALVESLSTVQGTAQIVVERAMYSNAGVVWAAGTGVVATKLK